MTYGRFLPKNSSKLRSMVEFRLKIAQNWDLSSKIQGLESLGCTPSKALKPWILDDKCPFWAIFRQKLTISLNSKWFSFKNLIERIFFCLTEFSFFDQAASFDLNFLPRPHRFFQNIFAGSLVHHVDAKNHSLLIRQLDLRYPVLPGRGVEQRFLVVLYIDY